MDTNIALAGLASGMAVSIGAAYSRGVHDAPPGWAWKHCHEKYVWTPVCFTTSPLHGLGQSYLITLISYKPREIERPQITSPTGGANNWKGADDNGHITEEPRAWKARTRGSEAEVDGAIYPSTVTNSGPLREPADKHSIYTSNAG